jgi:hypothetical protein
MTMLMVELMVPTSPRRSALDDRHVVDQADHQVAEAALVEKSGGSSCA